MFSENYVVASFLFGILFLSKIFLSHNQAPVVQKMDNAIYWKNHYPVGFPNTYPLHSDLPSG